jgi:AcrR family transcriptional regulator
MRADARRNRDRLLDAAVTVILETGGDPPLDAIAQRAEVGIGTLYRHFPDRRTLLGAVVRHVLDRTLAAGDSAMTDATDGADALRRYLHLALDIGVGVLNLVYPLLETADWPERRADVEALLRAMVERATSDGTVRVDASANDIALATIRFCRPLSIGLPPAEERHIAHRQIDIYLDGLAVKG